MKNRINPVWPLILLLVMLTSACSSTPKRIAYNTLQAASDTVFTSMQVYGGLVADGKVYIGDEDGDLMVFEASKEKKLLSTTNLGAPIYSTPVVANGVLYVSSNTHLFSFQTAARPTANHSQPAP